MKTIFSTLILVLAATAAWPAGSYRARASARSFIVPIRSAASVQGRWSAPRPRAFAGHTGFSRSLGRRGFSRGLVATPVTPGQTLASGPGAQMTGGSAAGGPFVGTANNTLIQSPGDARMMMTDGGGLVSFSPALGQYLTNAPGVFVGPADKAPSANPNSGGASGITAITPNGAWAASGN